LHNWLQIPVRLFTVSANSIDGTGSGSQHLKVHDDENVYVFLFCVDLHKGRVRGPIQAGHRVFGTSNVSVVMAMVLVPYVILRLSRPGAGPITVLTVLTPLYLRGAWLAVQKIQAS